jgi:hypothetical protein
MRKLGQQHFCMSDQVSLHGLFHIIKLTQETLIKALMRLYRFKDKRRCEPIKATTSDQEVRIVFRIFTEKGRGPARNQTLLTTAVNVLENLNNTAKTNTGTFMRVGEINGPTFSSADEAPHFVGRIDTSWVATVLT